MEPIRSIAVLGAGGTMGRGMATNLAAAGLTVRGWNRSGDKLDGLDGVERVDDPARACEGADAVMTMLSDADAVLDVARTALPQGALWIQASTIGLSGTEECERLAAERGATLVDAPVVGTKQPAQDGELVVLASGPDELADVLVPVFDAIGKKTLWAGETGAGTRLKLVVNAWLVSVVEGVAEAVALAEGLDVDPRAFLDAVDGGPLDAGYLGMKAPAMIERSFDPAFTLRLAAKDAALVGEAIDRHDLDLPILTAIQERFAAGAERHGDRDLSATFLLSAPD